MNPFQERKGVMKAIHRLAHAKEPAAKIRRDKEPVECRACGETAMREKWRDNLYICPHCGNHRGMTAASRIRITADPGSFQGMRDKTNLNDAVVTGTAKIHGRRTVLIVMDNRFMMGSMGMAVGEKVTRAFEYATKKKLPVIVFSTSGGARMQEGMMSLLQMAKTSTAVAKHDEAGLLYVSVMTHPTTGGVTASFAMLGDIQLAEPDALIGFAGPRVIEQTIGEKLPKGFQRAQFQYDHGFLDRIVDRREMRDTLGRILELHA